jgi:type 1 fimbriae regulatory protein FimB
MLEYLTKNIKLFLFLPVYESMINRRKREYLTLQEVEKLLEASKKASCNPGRDYCILLLMFRHGLRVSELCSLKLSDIDLESKTFHVRRLKGCDHGSHFFYDGESAAIKAWLVERQEMNAPATVNELFISERRRPLSRVTIFAMIRQVASAAGLEHLELHPHMLRHSCGYALVNKGVDVRVIQDFLGHRSISSTVRYTKLDRSRFAKLF